MKIVPSKSEKQTIFLVLPAGSEAALVKLFASGAGGGFMAEGMLTAVGEDAIEISIERGWHGL
jgi:1-deoxy-D-xylulose 5-phosphate reductoisomerase